jgi:hypothetical protein
MEENGTEAFPFIGIKIFLGYVRCYAVLGAFAKVQKPTITFVMSVC